MSILKKILKFSLIGITSIVIINGLTDIISLVFAANNLESKSSKQYSVAKYFLQEKRGRMYCYDEKENRVRGLLEIGGNTYYFNEKDNGAVLGWHTINGKRYFFDPKKYGAAHEGFYNEDSFAQMYFDNHGVMADGVTKSGDNYYLFTHSNSKNRENSYLTVGWHNDTKTGKRYYFRESGPDLGKAIIGWYDGDKTGDMYFHKDGSMAEGITEIDNEIYLFKKEIDLGNPKNAYLYAGWYTDPKTGKRYYFKENKYGCDAGKAAKGWFEDDCNGTMYFNKHNGAMVEGLVYVDGSMYLFEKKGENAYKYSGGFYTDPKTNNRYFFNPKNNGKSQRGWYNGDPIGAMYFDPSTGIMAKGLVKINGFNYVFKKVGDNYYYIR